MAAADEETYLYPNGIFLETVDEVILVKQDLKFDLNLVLKLPNVSSLVPKRSEWCDFQESDVQLLQRSTADFDVKLKELFHQFMTTAEGPEHLKDFSEDIKSPETSQELLHSRTRRSFQYLNHYWTLSGWTENQLRKKTKWTEGLFNQTNKRIDSLGVTVEREAQTIDDITHQICSNSLIQAKEAIELAARAAFSDFVNHLALQLELLQTGLLPSAVTNQFLHDFCAAHFQQNRESLFCSKVNIRRMLLSRLKKIGYDTQKQNVVIVIRITAPETDIRSHKILKVSTIPIFEPNNVTEGTHRRQIWELSTTARYIAVSTDPKNTLVVGFKDCDYKYDHYECRERISSSDEKCIMYSMNNSTEIQNFCYHETRSTTLTCIYKRARSGIVISTTENLHVHESAPVDSLFDRPAVPNTGLFFMENKARRTRSIYCSHQLVRTLRETSLPVHTLRDDFKGSPNFRVQPLPNYKTLYADMQRIKSGMTDFNKLNATYDSFAVQVAHNTKHIKWSTLIIPAFGILSLLAFIALCVYLTCFMVRQCKNTRSRERI